MRNSWKKLLALTLGGLLAAGATWSIAGAQEEDEGRVVPIAPEGDSRLSDALRPNSPLAPPALDRFRPFLVPGAPADIARQARPLSPYYIGIAVGQVSDALRAHVNIPESAGILVEQVWEDSPAEEAGLEQYDIVVSADGKDMLALDDLVAVVKDHGGDNPTRFTLDIIRQGKSQTLWVTPAKRPEAAAAAGMNLPQMRQPGFGFQLGNVPGSLSIQVQDENGEKKIVIERDGEKWEVVGDDEESLKALPEDLRPMVEQMLNAEGQLNFNGAQLNLNALPLQPGAPFGEAPEVDEMQRRMQEQMQRMEEQLRRLEQRLEEPADPDPRA